MTDQSAIKHEFSTTGTNKQQQCRNLHFITGGKKNHKIEHRCINEINNSICVHSFKRPIVANIYGQFR